MAHHGTAVHLTSNQYRHIPKDLALKGNGYRKIPAFSITSFGKHLHHMLYRWQKTKKRTKYIVNVSKIFGSLRSIIDDETIF